MALPRAIYSREESFITVNDARIFIDTEARGLRRDIVRAKKAKIVRKEYYYCMEDWLVGSGAGASIKVGVW